MKTLVIIPCYNEEKNIAKVVEELRSDFNAANILVVNDYSRDNSLEIIKSINVNYLNLPINLGYSGALQTGFKYAVENDYEYVIQFDGDGQHIASEAKRMLDLAQSLNVETPVTSMVFSNRSGLRFSNTS
jgi:glycosyltransferase involved in cell wall biosynthesis